MTHVWQKMIDGKQCAICWYVDDTKISHVDSKVVDQVIKKIETSFGKMTVTRGKTHNFVGMDLDFKDNGTLGILMQEYIKECIVVFGEEIDFLCTRVSKSTEEDWVKLRRLLHYLYGTLDMNRIIGAKGLDLMETYVDASYAVHHDMRGHTGALMTLGRGIIQAKASKQKLNTKSST